MHRVALAYLAASWLLVQILETTFPIYGLEEAGIRWVLLALLIGFVPALALAWVFEWSPKGIRFQAALDEEPTTDRGSSRKSDLVIIGVLSVALLYFALDKFLLDAIDPWNGETSRSIAVLPFQDMTAAQDQAFFADGLAEELLNLLAQNSTLRVAARTSSFSFRDSKLPIGDIAAQLHVGHVLEGSVRRDGERIRITVQLIDADSGFHVWSETYDEPFSDIFAIQDKISLQIAAALKATVLGDQAPLARTTDPQAYMLFLKAKYLAQQGSAGKLREATSLYRKALLVDPQYAPAWAELAATYLNQASSGFIDYDQGYRLGREAAARSVSIDPQYAPAYDQLAWQAFWYEGDLASAIRNLQKAIELAPRDPDLIGSASLLLQALGRIDEAIELHEYAVFRSPLDAVAIYNLALAYKYDGRLVDAEDQFSAVLRLSPDYAAARYHLGETLLLQGRTQAALDAWAKENDEAFRIKGEALGYFSLGETGRADQALEELIEKWGKKWPSEVAHVYAWRGEPDNAFKWLELEHETYGSGGWGEWRLQPLYAKLHDDPRWQAFLERMGASDAQLEQYAFEVTIPTR
ncbi:MAG: tetratricopeptide repeat protein [Halieaceae bacterium]|nr:tetratricopeptide repeat protein [Halieaceae bacterium]